MKQIEITTNVRQSLNEVDRLLIGQGFKIIRKSRVEDQYMIMGVDPKSEEDILSTLSHSLLIRFLHVEGQDPSQKLTYKKKTYEGDTVLTEEKISVGINDTKKARELLEALGFHKLVDVKYDVTVYEKEGIELAFQQVENLGLLLEYESLKDYEASSNEEVLEAKKQMLEELKGYQLDVTDDFDVKKAYQLIKNRMRGM